MKVMISQPMNGRINEEILKERNTVIKKLNELHIEVVDTVFNDLNESKFRRPALGYLSRSIRVMSEVDAVLFIGNWRRARGCIIEYEVASRYGIKILTENFLDNSHIIGLARTTENILDKPFEVNVEELRNKLTKEVNEMEII